MLYIRGKHEYLDRWFGQFLVYKNGNNKIINRYLGNLLICE